MFSYCVGFSRFSESVTYYLANVESTSHNDIRQYTFEGEMLSAYEILFNVWIKSNEAKVVTAKERKGKVKETSLLICILSMYNLLKYGFCVNSKL